MRLDHLGSVVAVHRDLLLEPVGMETPHNSKPLHLPRMRCRR
jgi:hypothetical protein